MPDQILEFTKKMIEPSKQYIIAGCTVSNNKPCLKRSVYAMVLCKDGKEVFGSNWIANEVISCPRAELPTGQGYNLCREVCGQQHHAETDAIARCVAADVITLDAKMYITGHDYCCDNCLAAIKSSGIGYVKCLDSNKEYYL